MLHHIVIIKLSLLAQEAVAGIVDMTNMMIQVEVKYKWLFINDMQKKGGDQKVLALAWIVFINRSFISKKEDKNEKESMDYITYRRLSCFHSSI